MWQQLVGLRGSKQYLTFGPNGHLFQFKTGEVWASTVPSRAWNRGDKKNTRENKEWNSSESEKPQDHYYGCNGEEWNTGAQQGIDASYRFGLG